MSKTYLVKFKPMESYFFGGNRQFQFEARDHIKENFAPYFIRGNHFPEQATVFGSLRFLILEQVGLIRHDFNYSQEEREKMADLVGSHSFSLTTTKRAGFGKLQQLSPLFIMNDKNEKIIPMPFNLVEDNGGYRPMNLQNRPYDTNHGLIELPESEEYDPKKGYSSGYYNVTTGKAETSIFDSQVMTGNRIPKIKDGRLDNEDGLFKREVFNMKEDYCFAVYLTVDDDLNLTDGFVQMGQKATPFKVNVSKEEDTLEREIIEHFKWKTPEGMIWHYALSDQVLAGTLESDSFAIVQDRQVRQIQTDLSKQSFLKSIQLGKDFQTLHKAGSVYYGNMKNDNRITHAQLAGYNALIRIGIEGETK